MKKAIVIVALAFAVVALMGCPSVNLPSAAGGATVGAKTGQASGSIILGLFGNVDAGMLAAAKNGGITKIATVDTEVKSILGFITTYTTTVTGE
jgi:uncharacterized protein (DUF2342 family)